MTLLQVESGIEEHTVQRDFEKGVMLWDSVPSHHVFNNLQAFKTTVSFQFVPIPGVSNFAHGMKLRLTDLRRAMLQRPGIFVFCARQVLNVRKPRCAPSASRLRLADSYLVG